MNHYGFGKVCVFADSLVKLSRVSDLRQVNARDPKVVAKIDLLLNICRPLLHLFSEQLRYVLGTCVVLDYLA